MQQKGVRGKKNKISGQTLPALQEQKSEVQWYFAKSINYTEVQQPLDWCMLDLHYSIYVN